MELWTCFLDFEKAFDSVEHEAIWKALSNQGVDPAYIRILKKPHGAQQGRVAANGKLSRPFHLERGTNQGDPLSTLLFSVGMRLAKLTGTGPAPALQATLISL